MAISEFGLRLCCAVLAYSLALGAQLAAATRPLALKIERGLEQNTIIRLKEVRQTIVEGDLTEELWGHRKFGLGGEGHEILHMHKHLDDAMPDLRPHLLKLAIRADESAGWMATNGIELAARCLEWIRYEGSHANEEPASIGWHNDGETLVTIAVMLSNSNEYEGGSVELLDGDIKEKYELAAGDVLAWRGWTSHRVLPVRKGLRDVLVVEWWFGEDCTTSSLRRGLDSLDGLRNALLVDPGSPILHKLMGKALCEKLPCADSGVAVAAEAEYRKAVELAPNDATSARSLGRFLMGRMSYMGILKRAEGLRYLSRASESKELNVAEEAFDEYSSHDMGNGVHQLHSDMGNVANQFHMAFIACVCIAILGIGVKCVERMEASLGTKAAVQELKKPDSATKMHKKCS